MPPPKSGVLGADGPGFEGVDGDGLEGVDGEEFPPDVLGDDGPEGEPGPAGVDGVDGADGVDGVPAIPGFDVGVGAELGVEGADEFGEFTPCVPGAKP